MTGVPIARLATEIMLGKKLKDFPQLKKTVIPFVGVKEAVFPFNMFPEVDPLLGPEMRATGEVMGIGPNFGIAFYKAQSATGAKLPLEGNVLLTVADKDKIALAPIAKKISALGFQIFATEGTAKVLTARGIQNTLIKKINEGQPNIADAIKNGELHLIVNTPHGRGSQTDDSYIRTMAIQRKLPYVTSLAAAEATAAGIAAANKYKIEPQALQDYYKKSQKA